MATRRVTKKSTETTTATTKQTSSAASRVDGTIARSLTKEIEFSFYAPLAKSVSITGTFNKWNPSASLLRKDATGNWKTAIALKQGRYEYKFVIDGNWENDQKNHNCVSNGCGGYNCVLEVK
jgi:1,4-alpha-glucan branching enzyme